MVKTQPVSPDLPPRPRIGDLRPVNENSTATYFVKTSDARQRVPLEPLFHIDTAAQPSAQPMSIDEASDLHSIQQLAQTHAVNGNGHAAEESLAAASGMHHDVQADMPKSEDSSSVKIEDAGQVLSSNAPTCFSFLLLPIQLCRIAALQIADSQFVPYCCCTPDTHWAPAFPAIDTHGSENATSWCKQQSHLWKQFSLSDSWLVLLHWQKVPMCNVQADKVLGQSKAGLLNRVHALEEANVPADNAEVMKVDGS